MSVITELTLEEANMGYSLSKNPGEKKKTDYKNYRKPENLARVIMFSLCGPPGVVEK